MLTDPGVIFFFFLHLGGKLLPGEAKPDGPNFPGVD